MRGRLDGRTILRFARAYDHGGGVEGHLADLNRTLGARHRLTTVQLQLSGDATRLEPRESTSGASRLITVPLLEERTAHTSRFGPELKARLLDALLPTAATNDVAMRELSRIRAVPLRAGCAIGAGARTAELFSRFAFDLVVLHACGGADTSEIIDVAAAHRVPVAIVHHFANQRLSDLSVRQQVARVQGVAGASMVGVPRYLRSTFRNLSDAVDTGFYDGHRAPVSAPVIYAPGRLTPEKGQLEVLDVARRLRDRGVMATVVFAGRADVPAFEAELRDRVTALGLIEAVHFAGALTLEAYRDWYARASLTLMPTRHSEGMPRTVIESQAMQVPPIVYDAGGTREGLRHGETGFLVASGDVAGLVEAADALLRDPERRDRMGAAGRAFVETAFSLDALAARHEAFYDDLIEASARATAGSRRSSR